MKGRLLNMKKRYKLKDYDIECEGDRMPQLRELNPETGKYKILESR